MNEAEFHEFVYKLHNKVQQMETWASTVRDAITDHADRIDLTKSRCHEAFTIVRSETDALRAADATAERDTREVMRLVQVSDDALKASLNKVVTMIDEEVSKMKVIIEGNVTSLTTNDGHPCA